MEFNLIFTFTLFLVFEEYGSCFADINSGSEVACTKDRDIILDTMYCNVFYQCVNNKPVQMMCHFPYVYDSNTGRCDKADKVDCRGTKIWNDQKNKTSVPSLNPACVKDGDILLDTVYCNVYYQCVNTNPVQMFCKSPLVYNSRSGRCDFVTNVDCQGTKIWNPTKMCAEAEGLDSKLLSSCGKIVNKQHFDVDPSNSEEPQQVTS